MSRKVLSIVLALSLMGAWAGASAAGQIGYSMRSAETGFGIKPRPEPPSSSVMAFDAIIGRPLGAATTIAGTGVFLLTLPFTLPTETTSEAAWGLAGRPFGWTFKRPLGRGAPLYEERGVFRP